MKWVIAATKIQQIGPINFIKIHSWHYDISKIDVFPKDLHSVLPPAYIACDRQLSICDNSHELLRFPCWKLPCDQHNLCTHAETIHTSCTDTSSQRSSTCASMIDRQTTSMIDRDNEEDKQMNSTTLWQTETEKEIWWSRYTNRDRWQM